MFVGVLEWLLEWESKHMKRCETIRQACVWWIGVRVGTRGRSGDRNGDSRVARMSMPRSFFEENLTTTDPTTHETDDTTPLTLVLMTGDSSDRAPSSQPDISLDSFTDMVQEIY